VEIIYPRASFRSHPFGRRSKKGQKSAVAGYCPNHGIWPENFVIPAKAGIQSVQFRSFPINSCCFSFLDSRLRGNDGGAVSVAPDKFLKLKISSFLQGQKTKNRNLKFVIPAKAGI
ncbi:hypothetical protein DBA62_002159, partial [Neisseria gonorrhoeae]|uniref:hypothetical protein n=6 Tax=Neisseria gonorrhoeae TaxID=485 RepID=UPI0030DBAB7C